MKKADKCNHRIGLVRVKSKALQAASHSGPGSGSESESPRGDEETVKQATVQNFSMQADDKFLYGGCVCVDGNHVVSGLENSFCLTGIPGAVCWSPDARGGTQCQPDVPLFVHLRK